MKRQAPCRAYPQKARAASRFLSTHQGDRRSYNATRSGPNRNWITGPGRKTGRRKIRGHAFPRVWRRAAA